VHRSRGCFVLCRSERSHIRKNFDVEDVSAEYKGKVVSRKSLQAFGDDDDDEDDDDEAADEDDDDDEAEEGEDEEEEEAGEGAAEQEDDEDEEDAQDEDDDGEDEDGEDDEEDAEGTKGMLASGLSAQQKRVQQQLAALEAQDTDDTNALLFAGRGAGTVSAGSKGAASQYTKSVHMANQQAWYSHMLNLRIRVQGLVAAANRLPPAAAVPLAEDASTATDAQKEVVAPHELRAGYEAASSSVAPAYSSALRGASRLLEDLFSLQSALLAQNTRIWASSQQDNAADDGQEAADNEDPETAEARLPKWQGLQLQDGKKRKRGADDNKGGDSDAEEDDNDDTSTVAAADPEEVLSAYWDYLSGSVTTFLRPVQDALLDKWNNKTLDGMAVMVP